MLDLAKWDEALYGTKLLKQSSLDRIWAVFPLIPGKPNANGYGFAWWIGTQNGHKRIGHGGAWQGFNCNISRYVDDGLTVVVLANLSRSNTGMIAHVAAGLVNPVLRVPRLEAIEDKQPELAQRMKKIMDEIVAGTDIRPEVSPQLAALITPEAAKAAQQELSKLWPAGTLTLVKRVKGPDEKTPWVSTFRLSKGDDALLLLLGVDTNGKIPILDTMPNRDYDD